MTAAVAVQEQMMCHSGAQGVNSTCTPCRAKSSMFKYVETASASRRMRPPASTSMHESPLNLRPEIDGDPTALDPAGSSAGGGVAFSILLEWSGAPALETVPGPGESTVDDIIEDDDNPPGDPNATGLAFDCVQGDDWEGK